MAGPFSLFSIFHFLLFPSLTCLFPLLYFPAPLFPSVLFYYTRFYPSFFLLLFSLPLSQDVGGAPSCPAPPRCPTRPLLPFGVSPGRRVEAAEGMPPVLAAAAVDTCVNVPDFCVSSLTTRDFYLSAVPPLAARPPSPPNIPMPCCINPKQSTNSLRLR